MLNLLIKSLTTLTCFVFLFGCSSKTQSDPAMISMQTIDRNGFSETVSSKDRLAKFSNVDFLSTQPYQKVLRVFPRNAQGQTVSRITSYHPNGQVWQYLEVNEGRAHGVYKEWHPNGTRKIEAFVLEGLADVGETAQASWLFQGLCQVWDQEEALLADFLYEKGVLHGPSHYFHKNGALAKIISYTEGEPDGLSESFSQTGELIEKASFQKGLQEGIAEGKDPSGSWKYLETYSKGKLLEGQYECAKFSNLPKVENGEGFKAYFENNSLHSIIEIHEGKPMGSIRLFHPDGSLHQLYHVKDEQKHGEEMVFFPSSPCKDPLEIPPHPKLSTLWHENSLQGTTKTWYENGILESQRELNQNKKHGLSLAYYRDGSLLLMEEYDADKLLRGSYYKRGDKQAVSRVEEGHGTATIHFGDGRFKQKISYDRGLPNTNAG